jgi:hypothetical protein
VRRGLERRNARGKFVEGECRLTSAAGAVALIHRRKDADLMDARMDGWTVEANSKFTPAASRAIAAYLYYKTAISSEIHYHKSDRYRIARVRAKRNGITRRSTIKHRALYNGSLNPRSDSQGHRSPNRANNALEESSVVSPFVPSSRRCAFSFGRSPVSPANCFPIGLVRVSRLVSLPV